MVFYWYKWYICYITTNHIACSNFHNGIATLKQRIDGQIQESSIDKTGTVVTDLSKYRVPKSSSAYDEWMYMTLNEMYGLTEK